MWSAIILRIRSISTMSYAPSTLVATGAALATGAGARAGVGAGVAFGAAWPRPLTNERMSFLVTRPSAPVPGMDSSSAMEMPSFSAMLRTNGE